MPRNRNWVWFFAAVAVLGAIAVAIPWAYNARQQLTRQQLDAAADLWDKHGPADYDLVVEKTMDSVVILFYILVGLLTVAELPPWVRTGARAARAARPHRAGPGTD